MSDLTAPIDFSKYFRDLDESPLVEVRGRVTEVVGLIVKAVVPNVWVGELCLIKTPHTAEPVKAEVVGFLDNEVLLMPLGDMRFIGMNCEVVPTGHPLTVKVGDGMLGRVLDGLGEPMDFDEKGPLDYVDEYPVFNDPPDPLKRRRILSPITVGIRAIDGLLTCGEGQRIGLFAAAGVGKSTLLGMIARNALAEVNVITLIGERGREVRDFLEKDLGPEGLAKSVVVVATSNEPSLVRLKGAYVGTAIAEYFRDKGRKVMLMMDSVTRFARAQREVGLACGEPPARAGYTPSVFSELPKLLERAGTSDKGSITAFYTVLVEGDDMNEPVADEVRSILDGHIILSRDLASRGHYPAINVSLSVSRVMTSVVPPEHRQAATKLREVLATYEKEKDLIMIGAYQKGSDARVDFAMDKIDSVNTFLKQSTEEKMGFEETVKKLKELF
ncbi:MAG TPA: flagellar protein export ATPase FliI [Acidobacteriota bacterium]|jgi:flagellar protein export ATPase FliI|nr:flagellar protein export ATPase FliI [Acidobacteriota bacterium]HPB29365.1 flagellar protein export ATPase FliI [Acidobacteriota bacterium]HQO26434.1 flagellar protein export ATPase FliI [Acidobacteriota bacterium]HQP75361.1 flagellar protein export ATPase FliI [Acidobacteriota bacterium]